MSETQAIETRYDGSVATLWLNRPERHNAFDDQMVISLFEAVEKLNTDDSIRVVILAGRGASFCAGADLAWMKRMVAFAPEENLADAQRLAKLMYALNTLSKPLIGRIHGPAFGGGVGLAACCDIVFASHGASFCLSEVKLGLIPSVIGPYVAAKIGVSAARRYFLSAETFSAEQAQALGLVHEVLPQEQLDSQLFSLADRLVRNAPQALAAAKQLIRDIGGQPISEAIIDDTAQRIAKLRSSPEGQEGLTAFLEKRPPNWV